MNYNCVLLMGHVTRDPELSFMPNQSPVCKFGIATNRTFRVGEEERTEVCFVDVTAYGTSANTINQYVKKGTPLFIEGHLKLDQWEDKNGGGKRSKLFVVLDHFQFVGGKKDNSGEQQQAAAPARPPQHKAPTAPAATAPVAPVATQELSPDDVPF
jgi:single-strand DNA-binding protein